MKASTGLQKFECLIRLTECVADETGKCADKVKIGEFYIFICI